MQPQSLEVSTGQQEARQLTTEHEISDRKQASASRRRQHDGQLNSGTEATPGIQ